MKAIFMFIATSLIASGFAHAESDDLKVSNLISRYQTALNASNAEDILKLYGQSPTFMPQHAPAQVGREAVRGAYDNVFEAIDLEIEFTTHDVEILGDTAWARTSSAGKTTILANGVVITEGNNELFIFKKERGLWKIHQYLFSTNRPRQ